LLTGKRLFDAEALVARLVKHRDQPPPSLVQVRDDAPWSLEQVLHKMVAKKPADRQQSMDEVATALEQFTNRGGASGMGSSVLRDADLSAFFHGMGSQVGSASKLGGGSPGSSNVLRPGSSGEILPQHEQVAISDPKSGSRSGTRPPSNIHAAAATMPGSRLDTDPALAKSTPQNSAVGRTSNIGRPMSLAKKKNPLPLVIGGVAVAGAAIAGGLMFAKKSGPDPIAAAPIAAPVAAPKPAAAPSVPFGLLKKAVDYVAERRVAQWVMGKGGMVGLAANGSSSIAEYKDRAPLPPGDWVVRRISLSDRRNVGDGELTMLAPLAELESLNLNRAGIGVKGIPYLAPLKSLKTLELSDANVRDADLDFLVGLTSLTTLVLHGSSVSEDGIAKLKHLPLERLEIGSIICGNALGKVLRNFAKLSTLRLNSVGLQDDGLAELSALKNLSTLSLQGMPLSDAGLKVIAGWSHLRDVTLVGGSFTPAGIQVLAVLNGMRRFEIEAAGSLHQEMAALQKALPLTEVWLDNVRVAPMNFPQPAEAAPAVPHNTLSAAEQAAGWKLLFDGVSLNGFKQFRGPAKPGGWFVVDGQIRNDGGGPHLATEQQYAHYELTFDFRLSPGGNSGVNYHVDEGQDPAGRTGPELELVADHRLGTIWNAGPTHGEARLDPPDAWHRIHLITSPSGSRHEVYSPDGKLLWSRAYQRNSPEIRNSAAVRESSIFWQKDVGKIVFQSRDRSVAFRNLKLRLLPADEAEKLVGSGR
jgi:hypothetical protein